MGILIFLGPLLAGTAGVLLIYFAIFRKEKVRVATPKVATGAFVIFLAFLAHRWSLIFDEQTRKKTPPK